MAREILGVFWRSVGNVFIGPPAMYSIRRGGRSSMSWGGPAKALAFALVMMSTALVALAAPAGTPQTAAIPGPTDPAPAPPGPLYPAGPGRPGPATVQGFLAD